MAVAPIDLSTIAGGTGGFVINGQSVDDRSGISVASAGDVNGDGFDDLIVGASGADPAGGSGAGKTYVVFGASGGFSAGIDLSVIAAGIGGFVINGQSEFDQSGFSVASAGDVNGDGLDDLIVGAYHADPAGRTDAGKSYVVFGKTGGFAASIDLATIAAGTGGFVINGQSAGDLSGISVASAGDVNGDGFDDLIVGADLADPAGGNYAGKSYVVFGTGSGFGASIDLSAVAAGTGGFVLNGQSADDQSGIAVASTGDVNGDGLDDLIVGARYADPAGGTDAGKSYVVFGKTGGFGASIDLSAVAAGRSAATRRTKAAPTPTRGWRASRMGSPPSWATAGMCSWVEWDRGRRPREPLRPQRGDPGCLPDAGLGDGRAGRSLDDAGPEDGTQAGDAGRGQSL